MPELARQYREQAGVEVRLVFGSSGNLFSQIRNGAPYDVFLSADVSYPRRLLAGGQGLPGSFTMYAAGTLVLFARRDSPLDLNRSGMKVVLLPEVKRIAVANPSYAPYGQAAMAALRNLSLYAQVKDKLVLGENVSQAAQFVLTGNAQIALTALALVQGQPGKIYVVPQNAYPPLEQGAVALAASRHPQAARAFVKFLSSDIAQATMRRYGFSPPPAAQRASAPGKRTRS